MNKRCRYTVVVMFCLAIILLVLFMVGRYYDDIYFSSTLPNTLQRLGLVFSSTSLEVYTLGDEFVIYKIDGHDYERLVRTSPQWARTAEVFLLSDNHHKLPFDMEHFPIRPSAVSHVLIKSKDLEGAYLISDGTNAMLFVHWL